MENSFTVYIEDNRLTKNVVYEQQALSTLESAKTHAVQQADDYLKIWAKLMNTPRNGDAREPLDREAVKCPIRKLVTSPQSPADYKTITPTATTTTALRIV